MTSDAPYRSLPDMLLRRVRATPDARAFAAPSADDAGMDWLTWAEVGERTKAIAAGLAGLGVGVEDRVAIIAGTRLDWVLADLGVNLAGAATTTVYPNTEPEDATFIVSDSGSKVVVAENPAQAAKVTGTEVTHVVLIDGIADPAAQPPQLTLAELQEQGRARLAETPDLIEKIAEGLTPEHLATLIYTSGTTGRPKGVELTHACWTWEGVVQGEADLLQAADLMYLWLPLSHAFGKCLISGIVHVGTPTYVDGRVDKMIEKLPVVRPTVLCAAPRVFEKVFNAAVLTARGGGAVTRAVFKWAVGTGRRRAALIEARKPVPALLKLRYALAERLVFAKLQQRLGGNIRLLVSGSAPLSRDISEFFAGANLPILEGYGLTETSAAVFVNRPTNYRTGTVGIAFSGLECRIDTDGEILLRGAPVMRGYHHLPQESAEAFTEDGFLRTGDIGTLDDDGFLTITDRKKDLFKTSGGKYIAPAAIENQFKAVCPYTSHVIVVGASRNFATMLVTLDEDAIVKWAADGPLAGKPYAEIVASPEAEKLVAGYVEQLNAKLNRWETIKKFTILPRDLTTEDGELTPSMKIRRPAVTTNFADAIDKMYADSMQHM
ncbi:AMP-dependent synthetase/ligase [Symbioplanes lichenis]|uniref:AMP-dependent synthetase/ligase n=1 Tax=Symbioplanes lichenis TaxID=1629072 RepID=UPI002738AADB|nr:long-chain fatty acid--CoA ligase [Actinoplanes lichenis]